MLKKIVILALILNTPYTLPSNSSAEAAGEALATAVLGVGAIASTWVAYKNFKKGWPAQGEVFRQIDILNEMGCTVYIVSKTSFEWDSWVVREHYKIEIPSSFSQEQKKKANEHWGLLLTNEKDAQNMLGWPAVASVVLSLALWSDLRGG